MGCLRLRGSARAMDMAKLCHDQVWALSWEVGPGGFMELGFAKRGHLQTGLGKTVALLRWRLGSSATNLVFGPS